MVAERERGGRLALTRTAPSATAPSATAMSRTVLPRTNRVVAAIGVVTCIVLVPLVGSPALSPSHATGAANTDDVAIELIAAPALSGVVRPDEPASVRVTITNTGDVATGDVLVSLDIDGSTGADAAQLSQWFTGATIASNPRTVASAEVSSLEPDASAVLDLIVPAAEAAFAGSFGARLATVTATGADAPADAAPIARDRTAMVWVPNAATAPVAATTFVAAIATPGEREAFLSAETLAQYTAPGGALARTLNAVAGRPVLLAVDPRVIASIRLLGADAPADALVFLDRLLAAPNESFLLPWADADPLVTIAAESIPLPRPEGTGAVTSTAAEAEASPSPTPSPLPEESATLDQLTEWPATLAGVAWAEPGALTTAAVSVISDDGTAVMLTPATSLEQTVAVQRLGDLQVLRTDDALATAARDASSAVSQQRFDQAMARVSALLAASAEAEPGIPAIIALSRDQLAGTDRLLDTIAQTVALPWATGGLVSEALRRPAVESSVVAPALDEPRVAGVQAALAAEAADRTFATIALTPESITDARRLELLAALSHGWGDSSIDALQQFVRDSTALRSSVQVVESSAITLLADRASLPVTVQNDLDVAVRVFVRVDPDTTQLRVLETLVETLVEPRSQTRALVPVESLTNGQVTITVTVQDGQSTVIGTPTRVALNLQAGWETAGTIAVGIALLLLLGFGISRDIRKRRRRRAEHE
jgi:hypothetical protein